MSVPGEKAEYRAADPEAAVDSTNRNQPLATAPLQYASSDSEESVSDPEKRSSPNERIPSIRNSSSSEDAESKHEEPQEKKPKPWYKRLNPLKRSKKPPVPTERVVSKEYTAGVWSRLVFQWMR